jgi:hypothetical protein
MEHDDITREQAAQMSERVGEALGYLARLRQRIDQRHFPSNDKFRLLVERAYDGVHSLSVELHYLSCSGGMCRGDKRIGR